MTRAKPKKPPLPTRAAEAQANDTIPQQNKRSRKSGAASGELVAEQARSGGAETGSDQAPRTGAEVPAPPKLGRTRRAGKAPKALGAQAPSVEPAQVASSAIKIFQIYYEPWQRELVEPQFIPLNNEGPPSRFLEFEVFQRLFRSDHVGGTQLWGALSWRFAEKTGLNGQSLLSTLAANPGYDVYFCNPFPQTEALYHNLWVHGETAHPRFLELSRAFLTAANLPGEDTEMVWPSKIYSTANYFVGSPRFWEAYLAFVLTALQRAERNLSAHDRGALYSTAADDRNVHGGSSYMPFVVERLFPLFLRTAGKRLKGFKIPLELPNEEMNVHLRILREMKDVAHQSKSAWLAACWVNYRNLYLTQHHGQQWVRDHLSTITPPQITFA